MIENIEYADKYYTRHNLNIGIIWYWGLNKLCITVFGVIRKKVVGGSLMALVLLYPKYGKPEEVGFCEMQMLRGTQL